MLEIEFHEGFRKPIKHATHFANGIGIIVRHSPELDFTSSWLDVPQTSRLPVYVGLDVSFCFCISSNFLTCIILL